jgi:hypothetical protein
MDRCRADSITIHRLLHSCVQRIADPKSPVSESPVAVAWTRGTNPSRRISCLGCRLRRDTRRTAKAGVNADGSPTGITGVGVTGPVVNGKSDVTLTVINSENRTYSQTQTEYSVPANAPATAPAAGLQSSPSEIQRALQNGRVTREGTTTVYGSRAIALSVTLPRVVDLHYTLYVDAQTYQPLRTVTVGASADNSATNVADWIPATPGNIAKATDNSIPAGYTKVDHLAG